MACNCQYGLTALLLGPIIFICAGVFRLLGAGLDMNGVAWWFYTNMAFFAIGAVLSVMGVAMECCGCCGAAKAREPLLACEEGERDEQGREKVPAQYVMIQ
mmetsp:Transcript_29087/g.73903  ORF Transcript_29087/g.73903 Transcript_29087/m.73903 type:complete len:101 (-) Transcript_29087:278-580(-)|eukprot:CAMPEP_0195108348 /NCGR_PEP_ID=MMETSP0448-20130528/84765_1 /TAXON_ID=66468 /ORGANISM="Heterocapsa triquestra, Strain CCMP 448" /LENGTH=100 /DNA_ID=CAMNT_0040144871 /DNA_START=1 /DNA_END=303 /DNA_ORIENTATION=-